MLEHETIIARRPSQSRWCVLFRHEMKLLRQNGMACFVLFLLFLSPFLLLAGKLLPQNSPEGVCYIVYWQYDNWIRALERAAMAVENDPKLQIVVAPVETFINKDDPQKVISYPRGTHSIQIVPLEPGEGKKPRWKIWYWHSGDDPNVIWPYARWFWGVTRRHFGAPFEWEEEISPLNTTIPTPAGVLRTKSADGNAMRDLLEVALVWMSLFFTACYLPLLSLSQEREQKTILSVVLTPAGWRGFARAKWLFYFLLSLALTVVGGGVLHPSALLAPSFWITAATMTIAYLGLAFTIGSLTESVAAAAAGLVVYGFISGVIYGISVQFYMLRPLGLALMDLHLITQFADLWGLVDMPHPVIGSVSLLILAGLAGFWHVAGRICYRRSCLA